jgi:deoxyribonuclease V
MFIAFDVKYDENRARAVAIIFDNWEDAAPKETIIQYIENIAEYEPGAFYKRELPCIMAILDTLDLAKFSAIVVDSYVILDDVGKLGLGGHLYEAIQRKVPVIGVAKTQFLQNTINVVEVLRGESHKPLYISALGIEMNEAAKCVRQMHGEYRFPTLLKLLDDITKEKESLK